MTTRARWGAGLSVFISVAVMMSGCSSPNDDSSESGKVTITFNSYNYGTPGRAGDGTKVLIDEFEKTHPDIKVKPQSVPVADMLSKTKTQVASGSPPDVVQMGYSKMAEAAATLPLQPLNKIAGSDWDTHVKGIAEGPIGTGTFKGNVLAMPYTVSVPAMFYNADLFKAAGLDPDNPPTSIDEIAEAAKAIKKLGNGTYGVYFAIVDSGKSDYLTQSVINSAGGSVVNDKGDITVDSSKAIKALTQVQDLTQDGVQPAVQWDEAVAAFGSGKIGMFISTTAVLSTVQEAAQGKFELRSTGFPTFGLPKAHPTNSGAGLIVLSKGSKKQKAAWEFVKYASSKDGYTIIAKDMGYLPLRADIVDDPVYLGEYFKTNTLLLPSIKQLADLAPYRYYPGKKAFQVVVTLQDDAIAPIVLQGAPVSDTLKSVADKMRGLAK